MAETATTRPQLPPEGTAPDELWALMEEARADDVDWRGGRVAGYLFLGGADVMAVAKRAYAEFSSENGLSAKAFPSLQRFESDVIAMTAGLLHGEHAVGSITGGGTESILLAVKSARDRARRRSTSSASTGCGSASGLPSTTASSASW